MSFRTAVPLLTTVLVLLGLAVVSAPAQAATDSPSSDPGCRPAAVHAAEGGFLFQAIDPFDGPSAQSLCIAECQDGSTVTCSGSSCNATDASCPTERGSCWGSDTGTKYCPPCTCSATALCPDGSTVSCTGTGDSCFGIKGCYVSCNDHLTWCSPRAKLCPVEAE